MRTGTVTPRGRPAHSQLGLYSDRDWYERRRTIHYGGQGSAGAWTFGGDARGVRDSLG